MVHALFCPHYDAESHRHENLKAMMEKTPGVAVAVDNCCAIEIVEENYRVISTKSSSKAYRTFCNSGTYLEQAITNESKFIPLSELLIKKSR